MGARSNIASDISNEFGYGEAGLVHEQSRVRTGLSTKNAT